MHILLIALATVGGLWLALNILLLVNSWFDERQQKRAWKKRKESFDYVARNIKDCVYWLNEPQREPFKEFFIHIIEDMKNNHGVYAQSLRRKVDLIIKSKQDSGKTGE